MADPKAWVLAVAAGTATPEQLGLCVRLRTGIIVQYGSQVMNGVGHVAFATDRFLGVVAPLPLGYRLAYAAELPPRFSNEETVTLIHWKVPAAVADSLVVVAEAIHSIASLVHPETREIEQGPLAFGLINAVANAGRCAEYPPMVCEMCQLVAAVARARSRPSSREAGRR